MKKAKWQKKSSVNLISNIVDSCQFLEGSESANKSEEDEKTPNVIQVLDLREKIIKRNLKTSLTHDLNIDIKRSEDITNGMKNEDDEYIGNNTNRIQCKVEWEDINHSDWEQVRHLTKDEERKELAQKQFRNPQPADPRVHLGFHGFRRKILERKVVIEDKEDVGEPVTITEINIVHSKVGNMPSFDTVFEDHFSGVEKVMLPSDMDGNEMIPRSNRRSPSLFEDKTRCIRSRRSRSWRRSPNLSRKVLNISERLGRTSHSNSRVKSPSCSWRARSVCRRRSPVWSKRSPSLRRRQSPERLEGSLRGRSRSQSHDRGRSLKRSRRSQSSSRSSSSMTRGRSSNSRERIQIGDRRRNRDSYRRSPSLSKESVSSSRMSQTFSQRSRSIRPRSCSMNKSNVDSSYSDSRRSRSINKRNGDTSSSDSNSSRSLSSSRSHGSSSCRRCIRSTSPANWSLNGSTDSFCSGDGDEINKEVFSRDGRNYGGFISESNDDLYKQTNYDSSILRNWIDSSSFDRTCDLRNFLQNKPNISRSVHDKNSSSCPRESLVRRHGLAAHSHSINKITEDQTSLSVSRLQTKQESINITEIGSVSKSESETNNCKGRQINSSVQTKSDRTVIERDIEEREKTEKVSEECNKSTCISGGKVFQFGSFRLCEGRMESVSGFKRRREETQVIQEVNTTRMTLEDFASEMISVFKQKYRRMFNAQIMSRKDAADDFEAYLKHYKAGHMETSNFLSYYHKVMLVNVLVITLLYRM